MQQEEVNDRERYEGMKTVWEARDRQGIKRFAERPKFYAWHDIFMGRRATTSKNVRVIRRFTAKVICPVGGGEYPKTIKVESRKP